MRVAVDATVKDDEHVQRARRHTRRTGGPLVVVGAHLDSVPEGPGINDNGSAAVASILETALPMAELGISRPTRSVSPSGAARRRADRLQYYVAG